MKVNIWVHRNDAINNKITDYKYTRPYTDRNDEWVEISISQEHFVTLEDIEDNDWGSTHWLREQYNRNREHVDQIDETKTQRIFERNKDNGVIKSRIAGDYGNERIEDGKTYKEMNSSREKLEEKIKQSRLVINELQDYMKVTGGEFKDWFNDLSDKAKTMYRDELARKK